LGSQLAKIDKYQNMKAAKNEKKIKELEEKYQKILQKVETVLSNLSTEFNVPMPMYCVYGLFPMKRLGKFQLSGTAFSTGKIHTPWAAVIPGATFVISSYLRCCYLVLFLRNKNFVGKEHIIHEFFHYMYYVKEGHTNYKNKSADEFEREEKKVQADTRKYMKKLRNKVK